MIQRAWQFSFNDLDEMDRSRFSTIWQACANGKQLNLIQQWQLLGIFTKIVKRWPYPYDPSKRWSYGKVPDAAGAELSRELRFWIAQEGRRAAST